jgi:hypothetical protein
MDELARLTKREAAIHTARTLLLQLGFGKRLVTLLPVLHPFSAYETRGPRLPAPRAQQLHPRINRKSMVGQEGGGFYPTPLMSYWA